MGIVAFAVEAEKRIAVNGSRCGASWWLPRIRNHRLPAGATDHAIRPPMRNYFLSRTIIAISRSLSIHCHVSHPAKCFWRVISWASFG